MNINDAIFNSLSAFEGTISDKLMKYYGGTGSLNDRERAWLIANGGSGGHAQDMWFELLRDQGYTGSLNDMKLAYWSGNTPINLDFGYIKTTSLKGAGWLTQRRTSTNTDAMWVNGAEEERTPVAFRANADGTYLLFAYDRTGTVPYVAQRGDEAQSGNSNDWYYFVPQSTATPDRVVRWTPNFSVPFIQTDDESGLTARSELFAPNEWVRWTAGGGTDDITFEWLDNPEGLRDWLIGNNGTLFGYARAIGMGALRNRIVQDDLIFRIQVDNNNDLVEMRMENNAQVGTARSFELIGNGVRTVVDWNNNAYTSTDAAFTAMVAAANGTIVELSILEYRLNRYVNPLFAGGGPNTACDDHTLTFNSNGCDFVDNKFLSNTANISGRSVLAYSLEDNNPDLLVGDKVRIEYTVQSLNLENYGAAFSVSGSNNITVTNSNRVAPSSGLEATVFYEFTIDALPYTASFRIGCGTTANNTVQLSYTNPSLVLL